MTRDPDETEEKNPEEAQKRNDFADEQDRADYGDDY